MSDKNKCNKRITQYIVLGLISLIVISFLIKFLFFDFGFNFSDYNFSDFLSLIVALFAMGISIAFYFKTTDSSNKFYDNTYQFTTKMSEILSRVEIRFGEGMKRIDKNYQDISGILKQKELKKEETDTTKKQITDTINEKDIIINEILDKLPKNKKEDYKQKISEKENELDNLQKKLLEQKEEISKLEDKLYSLKGVNRYTQIDDAYKIIIDLYKYNMSDFNKLKADLELVIPNDTFTLFYRTSPNDICILINKSHYDKIDMTNKLLPIISKYDSIISGWSVLD